MCAVGQYLEEEGVATTQISLVREHTVVMTPPRALWVPFMMGRPFGVPNDAAFQSRVLGAALDLLVEPSGPILRDYLEEAPVANTTESDGESCPVSFSRAQDGVDGVRALAQEIAQLRPWYTLATQKSGRTTVGVSGLTPEQVGAFVAEFAGGVPPDNYRPEVSIAHALKLACDDLRSYYEEAGAAQPGPLSASALEQWYYLNTEAGRVLRTLREVCLVAADPALQHMGRLVLIPRSILSRY